MNLPANPELCARIYHSVTDVDEAAWDALSAGKPFQSAGWYRYSEKVMEGCRPSYIVLFSGEEAVARASFWAVREEPLPIPSRLRNWVMPIFRRWPLMICRSPLSNLTGLVLPEGPVRDEAIGLIARTARKEMRRLGGSFLLFDFLGNEATGWKGWPAGFKRLEVTDPGTRLDMRWDNFADYLEAQHKYRIHQHYRRSSQEAAALGIRVTRHARVEQPDKVMELINTVERKHGAAPNPWAGAMLEQMELVESTWLAAHIGERLVGCMLLLVDNGVQIASLPGLVEDVPFAYFMLLYEAIQEACEKKLKTLLWGSGAYETKRRLGFELERNNFIMFQPNGWLAGLAARLAE